MLQQDFRAKRSKNKKKQFTRLKLKIQKIKTECEKDIQTASIFMLLLITTMSMQHIVFCWMLFYVTWLLAISIYIFREMKGYVIRIFEIQ